MEIRTIYCDLCKEKIDECNIWDLRNLKKDELTHYRFYRESGREGVFLTSGMVCKKCSKKLDKKIKQLFKEMGFEYKWKELED